MSWVELGLEGLTFSILLEVFYVFQLSSYLTNIWYMASTLVFVGFMVGWSVLWLFGWLVGWSIGWSVDWLYC